jgi:hypothetical protein
VLTSSVMLLQHLSTAGAFKLGVVWPPFVQPWSRSERLPPVYLLEELVTITTLPDITWEVAWVCTYFLYIIIFFCLLVSLTVHQKWLSEQPLYFEQTLKRRT